MGRLKNRVIHHGYFMFMFAFVILFCVSTPVHAETNGRVYIEANYSSNIKPQSGDEFELVYMLQGGTDSATITLDASNYVENTGMFELPEAYYEITSITYKGSNPAIPSEGYGVRRDFVSSKDGGSYIYLSIGQSANIALEQNYEGALFVDPTNAINEQESVERESTTYEEVEGETTEYIPTEESIADTEESAPANRSTEEVEVEHYDEEDNIEPDSRLSSIFVKLAGVGVLAVLGLVVIFILRKRGKI